MMRCAALALVLLAGCAAPSGNTEVDVAPTINQAFKNPDLDVADYQKRFSDENRAVYAARNQVVQAMALNAGEHIADVGAGTGIYMSLFANAVGPTGKVYANDIAPKFLALLADTAKSEGLNNVQTVLGDDKTTNLPTGALDVVFHSDVYHHFEYPATMNADLKRALKPGGRLYVLELEKTQQRAAHVRADKATVIAEIERAGFKFVEQINVPGLQDNYLLLFRKAGSS